LKGVWNSYYREDGGILRRVIKSKREFLINNFVLDIYELLPQIRGGALIDY
jgi:hypothetical protein